MANARVVKQGVRLSPDRGTGFPAYSAAGGFIPPGQVRQTPPPSLRFCVYHVSFATHLSVPANRVKLIMNHSPRKIKYFFAGHIFHF